MGRRKEVFTEEDRRKRNAAYQRNFYHTHGDTRYKAPVGKCEICGEEAKLVWDHDHTTGQFRGWLCNGCNVALGLFKDDEKRIAAAIEYLRKERPVDEKLSKHSRRVRMAESLSSIP